MAIDTPIDSNSADTRPGDTSDISAATFEAAAAAERSRDSISTACLPCRSKHLKCDGSRPCKRCLSSGSECAYVASRRGYKGPRRAPTKNPNKRLATSPPDAGTDDPLPPLSYPPVTNARPQVTSPDGSSSSGRTPASSSTQGHVSVTTTADLFNTELNQAWRTSAVSAPLPTLAERCFTSYYQNFHAAHPFVVPKEFFHLISPPNDNPEALMAAMRWVGSLYIPVHLSRRSLLDEACHKVYSPTAIRNVFHLQAMMIMVVGLDGMGDQDKARETLLDAEKLATDLAVNTRPFALFHGQGIPVIEESLRRTWWDLLIIDGMIAGVHRVTHFALYDVPADVALPCEEQEYLSGQIPPPRYLEELEERDFTDDDRGFSSFAYRILCGRNLGRVMRTPPILTPDDENLAKLEALLTNWRLGLPESKRTPLDSLGRVDEMMFQAFMMNYATSVMVHQPHSQLDTSPVKNVDACAPHQAVVANKTFNSHTRHVMASATEITKLITLRVPLLSHTHFFTCVISMSSIVHLCKWALHFMQYDDDDLRQQLRLNINALNQLSSVWVAAGNVKGQVQGVAKEIYSTKKSVQAAPQYWQGYTRDQILRFVAADDEIIEEVESNSSSDRTDSTNDTSLGDDDELRMERKGS